MDKKDDDLSSWRTRHFWDPMSSLADDDIMPLIKDAIENKHPGQLVFVFGLLAFFILLPDIVLTIAFLEHHSQK